MGSKSTKEKKEKHDNVNKNLLNKKTNNIINNKGNTNERKVKETDKNIIQNNVLNINQIGDMNRYYEIKDLESYDN